MAHVFATLEKFSLFNHDLYPSTAQENDEQAFLVTAQQRKMVSYCQLKITPRKWHPGAQYITSPLHAINPRSRNACQKECFQKPLINLLLGKINEQYLMMMGRPFYYPLSESVSHFHWILVQKLSSKLFLLLLRKTLSDDGPSSTITIHLNVARCKTG